MVLLQQEWEAVSCLHVPLRSASAPPWGHGQATLCNLQQGLGTSQGSGCVWMLWVPPED